MTLKRPRGSPGTLVVLEHVSRVLKDNPLRDPHVRKVGVWLPPQYDAGDRRRFPVLYDLVGYTGSGLSHANWQAFSENLPERAARLIRDGRMGPTILVMPDCFTALGGNQYVNSSATGDYADYLTREIVPFVDCEFRTLASREHRGCFGKSSGGYGAMLHGMKYAKYWGAIANHSGDAYFEFVYWPDWPNTLNELAKLRPARPDTRNLDQGLDDGRIRRFLQKVWKKEKVSGKEIHCLMNLCMAATYDPDPRAPLGFRVPFHMETGEALPGRSGQPGGEHRASLKSLRGIYIDCGSRDQYHIHYGSRTLSKRLAAAGVRHRYEEFDDDHSDINYRMDVSLPFLYKALKP
jgi:hypothetical protein